MEHMTNNSPSAGFVAISTAGSHAYRIIKV